MLTKPPGSLGRLEELAVFFARRSGVPTPQPERVDVLLFAGSHGIAARGVSAFPAEVTAQMVANFSAGGAAINQLAKQARAHLSVTALEIDRPTRDFTGAAAMDEQDFVAAVGAGVAAIDPQADLICLGEMGIGNTTEAAAVCAALFSGSGSEWVGRGTGVDDAGLVRKAETVDAALAFHRGFLADPLEALRRARLSRRYGQFHRGRRIVARRVAAIDTYPVVTAVVGGYSYGRIETRRIVPEGKSGPARATVAGRQRKMARRDAKRLDSQPLRTGTGFRRRHAPFRSRKASA